MAKTHLRNATVAICVMAVFLFSLYQYIRYVEDQLWQQAVHSVLYTTEQGNRAFTNRIVLGQTELRTLSATIERFARNHKAQILELLAERSEQEETAYYYFEPQAPVPPSVDQTAWQYVQDNLQLSQGIIEPHTNTATGTKVFDVFVKSFAADGRAFYLVREYVVNQVAAEFTMEFYDAQGFSYIVNDQGDILLRPSHPNSNKTVQNIFDIVAQEEGDSEAAAAFYDALRQDHKGWATLRYNGEPTLFCFVPTGEAPSWNLVTIIPVRVVEAQGQAIVQRTLWLLALVFFGIALTVGLFAYSAYRSSRIIREREYRDFLFELLSGSTDNVFLIYDPHRQRADYVFENTERLFGVRRDTVLKDARALTALFAADETARDALERALSGTLNESVLGIECPYRAPGSPQEKIAKIDIYATDDPRFGKKCIMCLQDQTDEIELRRLLKDSLAAAEKANRAKNDFLNNMSHDIRTPMNAIVGMTVIAASHLHNPDKVRDCLSKIAAASDHLRSLINDVLDMSRIESGKMALNEEAFNLSEMMHALVGIVQNEITGNGLSFFVHNSNIHHEDLIGDTLRINQICLNLLGNAMKFTQPGGRITLAVEEIDSEIENTTMLKFTCSDTGIGMSAEFMQRLFQPFEREQSETVKRTQGTGLGLAITKNIVTLMRGDIEVDSIPGKGSTFTVNLPLKTRQVEEVQVPDALTKLSILVADDDPVVCETTQAILNDLRMRCDAVCSGQEALEKIRLAQRRQSQYAVAIIDWKMPEMDGLETVRRIRKLAGYDLPIIILSAYDWTEIEEEAKAVGVSSFIAKPLFKSNLLLALKNIDSHAPEHPAVSAAPNYAGLRMLLVEDNELNMEIASEIIGSTGIAIEQAWNGAQALKMLEAAPEGHYDIVFSDVQMPVMDGYEATRRIRALNRDDVKDLPIIAMTANAFAEDRQKAQEAGMSDYISKPVDIDELFALLHKWLRCRKA